MVVWRCPRCDATGDGNASLGCHYCGGQDLLPTFLIPGPLELPAPLGEALIERIASVSALLLTATLLLALWFFG